jgi:hypothetical protein
MDHEADGGLRAWVDRIPIRITTTLALRALHQPWVVVRPSRGGSPHAAFRLLHHNGKDELLRRVSTLSE